MMPYFLKSSYLILLLNSIKNMGGGISREQATMYEDIQLRKFDISDMDVINLMMPVYYTKSPVTDIDILKAKTAWDMVLHDTSPKFLLYKNGDELQSISKDANSPPSCMMWFYDTFYQRLFDVHPTSRALFTGGNFTGSIFSHVSAVT